MREYLRTVPNALITALVASPEPLSSTAIRGTLKAMGLRQRQEIGKRVMQARLKTGLDRKHFAATIGISRNTLQTLEEGSKAPTERVLEKVAFGLGVPLVSLLGMPPLDPDDPKLRDLTEEDLEIAQAFHHAPLAVRQRTLGMLQERARHESLSSPVSDWVKRLLALTAAQRTLLAQLITEMEQQRAPGDAVGLLEGTVPAPIRHETVVDQKRVELWDITQE